MAVAPEFKNRYDILNQIEASYKLLRVDDDIILADLIEWVFQVLLDII